MNDWDPGLQPSEAIDITAPMERTPLTPPVNVTPAQYALVHHAARSVLGCVREHNEDKYECRLARRAADVALRGHLFVVCDGMGGHSAGQIASEVATVRFSDALYDSAATEPVGALRDAGRAAAQAVHARRGHGDMGTTLTAALVTPDGAWIAHIGDSRCLLVRGDTIQQLTEDHSLVAEQVRRGLLTAEQAARSPIRNMITRCLGLEPDPAFDIHFQPLEPGDRLLLCSDGLSGLVDPERLLDLASQPDLSAAVRQMVDAALDAGGHDNCTVILVEFITRLSWERAVELTLGCT